MKVSTRISAFVMALVMLFSVVGASTSSVFAAGYAAKEKLPVSAGIEALRDEFEPGVVREANVRKLDYSYYSPVGTNDNTKYPLVIFLHGIGHAAEPGAQVADSYMPYWASKELQARFSDASGAFILMPRSPEDEMIYWSNSLIQPLYEVIRQFIADNKDNIDTTRIYISGSSQGGAMVWKMCKAYPGLFAAAFPLAATQFDLSAKDAEAAKQTAFWIIASKNDMFVNYQLCTQRIWKGICKNNEHPENCRLTSFGNVTNPDGEPAVDNHHLARVVTYDLFLMSDDSPLPDMETVDGLGNTVELASPNGLISWMSAIHSDYDGHDFEGSGTYKGGIFASFLDQCLYRLLKLVNIIQINTGLVQ